MKNFNGLQAAAELLNGLDKEAREKLLANIAKENPEMAKKLLDRMFTFEDLAKVSGRQMQALLREIPGPRLALAMRAASESLKAFIFSNLSKRAADILQEEITSMGPQKKSEVENAQREILEQAKKMNLDVARKG